MAKKIISIASQKKLILAEKPSVAKDIADAIAEKFTNHKTHYESDHYIVSFAVGHLVTICTPAEINENYKSWTLGVLPIIPPFFPLKPINQTKSQLNQIKKLIKRKDVVAILNACDAGREGELIFRYILDYIGEKAYAGKKLSRVWLQSMTRSSIQEGLENTRKDEEMKGLENAAKCRSESDWLIGINSSRALTAFRSKYGGFQLTPCGRVQTPTLSIVVTREQERQAFQPQAYWEVMGQFSSTLGSYEGKWFDPNFKKDEKNPHGRDSRIWEKEKADQIVEKCQGQEAEVSENSKPASVSCPPLYDLTSLQREANSRFGFSAKRTLDILQSLYDRHKALTYPRTDSKYLPENYLDTVKKTMKSLGKGAYGKFSEMVLSNGWVHPDKRIFNNAKISDHHAIIPTNTVPNGLSEVEQKIYTAVVQRTIAIFFPPAKFLNTTRISVVEGESFKTEGKIVKEAGWKEVYGSEKKEERELPEIPPSGKGVRVEETEASGKETQPPPHFTESTLLSMMEGAGKLVDDEELREAMHERGLGTPATRAAIIEGLIKDRYLVRQGRDLVSTAKAMELMEILTYMKIEELASPEMTGEWEYRMEQILRGKGKREEFMRGIEDLTRAIVKKIKNFNEESDVNRSEAFVDSKTGAKYFEAMNIYESEDGKTKIRKFMGGRPFSQADIKTLVEDRKLGPLSGFLSKGGKPFSAMIQLTPENKIEFVFEDSREEVPDFSSLKVVGVSPTDGTKVYDNNMSYVSESYFDKESKSGFKVNKVILDREISVDNMAKMLAGEKTELIRGFQSVKKRRQFDAFLSMDKKGKISFSFPAKSFGGRRRNQEKTAKDS